MGLQIQLNPGAHQNTVPLTSFLNLLLWVLLSGSFLTEAARTACSLGGGGGTSWHQADGSRPQNGRSAPWRSSRAAVTSGHTAPSVDGGRHGLANVVTADGTSRDCLRLLTVFHKRIGSPCQGFGMMSLGKYEVGAPHSPGGRGLATDRWTPSPNTPA